MSYDEHHINDSEQIVGYLYLEDPSESHACIWEGGLCFDLGPIQRNAEGYAINNRGWIAGMVEAKSRLADQNASIVPTSRQ